MSRVSVSAPVCCCRVFGGSSSFSIIESMQQVVVDIRIYLLYLLLMVRVPAAAASTLTGHVTGQARGLAFG